MLQNMKRALCLYVLDVRLWKSVVEIHGVLRFLPELPAPPPLPLCSLLSQPNQHFASLSWECLAFFETYNYHAPWDVLLAVGQLFEPLSVVPVSPSLSLLVLHLPHKLFARLVYCPTSLFTTQLNCFPLYFPQWFAFVLIHCLWTRQHIFVLVNWRIGLLNVFVR